MFSGSFRFTFVPISNPLGLGERIYVQIYTYIYIYICIRLEPSPAQITTYSDVWTSSAGQVGAQAILRHKPEGTYGLLRLMSGHAVFLW